MSSPIGISYIMACYNTVGFQVTEAVNSLRAQKMRNEDYEIIIINDGSTNQDTLAAIKKFEGIENIKIIHQENKGQSAARNAGLRAAKFKYCLPVDSDDMLSTDFSLLRKHDSYPMRGIRALEDNPQLAYAFCNNILFGAVKNQTGVHRPFNLAYVLSSGGIGANIIYNRDDAIAAGGYPENLNTLEDRAFLVSLLNYRKKNDMGVEGLHFKEPYYLYRQHEHRNNVNARARDWDKYYNFLVDNNPEIHQHAYFDIKPEDLVAHIKAQAAIEDIGEIMRKLTFLINNPKAAVNRIPDYTKRKACELASLFRHYTFGENHKERIIPPIKEQPREKLPNFTQQ